MMHPVSSSRAEGSTPMEDSKMNDLLKNAYEKEILATLYGYSMLVNKFNPPVKLTRKQQVQRWWRNKKWQLGRYLYSLANKLGYYDDSY